MLFTHGYLPVLRGHSRGGAVRFSERNRRAAPVSWPAPGAEKALKGRVVGSP
ncbi:hypothetical protein P355_1926 [Burkholderia cenocepacia KC-01]|nr:hypothetical protein P355_1926 [Burkholderia cenocepacia KC-01]